MNTSYDSFGRVNSGMVRRAESLAEFYDRLDRQSPHAPASFLAFGNGKSYGDSCHNNAGILIDTRAGANTMEFDAESGVLTADAGVMLHQIIEMIAGEGYFLPVTPGTQFVTLGGAVANDVHGKNHHVRGTFGKHVISLDLLRSDGKILHCTPTQNHELFAATIGGMGLTGIIVRASVKMMPVPSADIIQACTPFRSLKTYFELSERADAENEYAVAWIDQLAHGEQFGRGILLTGNHAETPVKKSNRRRLSVPFQPPFTLLNKPFLRAFNRLYFRSKTKSTRPTKVSCQSFFFPLDAVKHWNRLYGPRGLYQHQSVIPFLEREAIGDLLKAAQDAGQGSFLTVLKRFGDQSSPGLLSFPRPGYTLTLDFPNRGQRTLDLLNELDRITIAAGGRVNPYKDHHMSARTFEDSFPQWPLLETLRDPLFNSDFWRRTAMRLPLRDTVTMAAE